MVIIITLVTTSIKLFDVFLSLSRDFKHLNAAYNNTRIVFVVEDVDEFSIDCFRKSATLYFAEDIFGMWVKSLPHINNISNIYLYM